jgi:hypothetical protein
MKTQNFNVKNLLKQKGKIHGTKINPSDTDDANAVADEFPSSLINIDVG